MKVCEYCGSKIDGSFASGRFCDRKCSSGYSTREKRREINETVSTKLKGKIPEHLKKHSFKKGFDPRRRLFLTREEQLLGVQQRLRNLEKFYETASWEELPRLEKRRRVLAEQGGKCLCGISEWLGERLTLEFHHVDGNRKNDGRENLQYLCPNCHSLTPTYRTKNMKAGIRIVPPT